MKSPLPKVLHRVAGRTLIDHVVSTLESAGIEKIVVTVGFGREAIVEELLQKHPEASIAVQEEQLGTGHASQVALAAIPEECDEVGIFSGDTPLLTADTIRALTREHRERCAAATILTAEIDDPAGYGRVVRDGEGYLSRVVEEKDATREERAIREINAGTYLFNREALLHALQGLTNDNAQGEYYLPDAISLLRGQGERVAAYTTPEAADEVLGVNTIEQLSEAEQVLLTRGGMV